LDFVILIKKRIKFWGIKKDLMDIKQMVKFFKMLKKLQTKK
jgi:hypothetical protein